MATKLTPFGAEARKLRIDHEMRLFDLAEKMGKSTAFISAVETGRKPIPDAYLAEISRAMNLSAEEVRRLRSAAEKTRKEVRVDNLAGHERELVAAFARKLDDVPDAILKELKKIVLKSIDGDIPFQRKRRGVVVQPMSTNTIRNFSEKVRSIFIAEERFDFPIIEVLEYRLPTLFPDFVFDVQDVEAMEDDEGRVYAGGNEIILRGDVYEGACRGNGRDRFTACHEFGHYLMHREVKLARAHGSGDKIYTDSEWQADEFAGGLMFSHRHAHVFDSAQDAAAECIMSPRAAGVMLSKYEKEGRLSR